MTYFYNDVTDLLSSLVLYSWFLFLNTECCQLAQSSCLQHWCFLNDTQCEIKILGTTRTFNTTKTCL